MSFSGYWYRPEGAVVELRLRSEDPATLLIDRQLVLERTEDTKVPRVTTSFFLARGLHLIELQSDVSSESPSLRIHWTAPHGRPKPLDPVFPSPPDLTRLKLRLLARALAPLFLALSGAFGFLFLFLSRKSYWLAPYLGRASLSTGFKLALLVIVVYAALLRFEALVGRYWWSEGPGWAILLARRIQHLRPDWPPWLPAGEPYRGDPFSYLRYAREMRHFYDAHPREPVFVLATKFFLWLCSGGDIAVNFAAASFSVATVAALYLLGSTFSRGVGLLAALAFAVERQVIALSVEGWRDDAFAFFVVLASWALLRLDRSPRFVPAVVAGLCAGLACLTRITSLSFLLPAYLFIAFGEGASWKRVKAVLESCSVLLLTVGPFLLTSVLVFGDPLYSINAHTSYYAHGAPVPFWVFLSRLAGPFHLADVGLMGLTAHPFGQMWNGFDSWASGLGEVLSKCALAGMLQLLFFRRGRLLLLILGCALVPFAFTYEILGGAEWRFDLHAYPLYLIASSVFVVRLVSVLRPRRARLLLSRLLRSWRPRIAWSLGSLACGVICFVLVAELHYLRVAEDIRGGKGHIQMGMRDFDFVGSGWHSPVPLGNETVRFSRGPRSTLFLPLVGGHRYGMTLRMDPAKPPQRISVVLNGVLLADLKLATKGDRIGAYNLTLPPSLVREGRNTLELVAGSSGFFLWSVQVSKTL